jgi:hypothetical protein
VAKPGADRAAIDGVAGALGAIVAGGLVLFATSRYGPGISPDSAAYLSIAENAKSGHGFVSYTGQPVADFAPGLPAVLASVGWAAGSSVATAARIVNACSLAAIVLEATLFLRRHVSSPVLRVVGIGAAAVAPPLVYVAMWAWSEPLFVAVALAAILAIEACAERPGSRRWVVAAALLAAAAFATRYIGAAVAVTGAIVLAFGGRPLAGRVRAARAALFGAIFASAAGLVILRNVIVTSTAFGPRKATPIPLGRQLHLTVLELSSWLVPRGLAERPRLVVFGLVLACVPIIARAVATGTRRRRSSAPLAVFSAAYLILLEGAAALTRIDPIDARLLAPLFVPLLVLGFSLLDGLDEGLTRTWAAPVAGALAVLAAGWAVAGADNGIAYARSVRAGGAGYADPRWRESELAQSLRTTADSHRTVYTDAPAEVWAATRRRARCLPPQLVSFCTGLRGDPRDMMRLLADRSGVDVAWFNYPGAPPRPVVQSLAFTVRLLGAKPDGAVYLLAPRS